MITEQRRNRACDLVSDRGQSDLAPSRMISVPGQFSQFRMLFQELAGHDHALDLIGALVDLGVVGCGYRRSAHTFDVKQLTR
jgi:hypothetical protein